MLNRVNLLPKPGSLYFMQIAGISYRKTNLKEMEMAILHRRHHRAMQSWHS